MAVWDLNSNLDVFSMQTFLRGLIYVRWGFRLIWASSFLFWMEIYHCNYSAAISWWERFNFQWNHDEVRFVLDQHALLDFHSASSLKQQSYTIDTLSWFWGQHQTFCYFQIQFWFWFGFSLPCDSLLNFLPITYGFWNKSIKWM
jgi:hypothetical protein